MTLVPKIDMERETATRRLSSKQERVAPAQEILECLPQTDRVVDLAREIMANLQADLDR